MFGIEENIAIATIDGYFAQYEGDILRRLEVLRQLVHEEAPEVKECMSWQMPTFRLRRNLIHFAVHKRHIGLYPGAEGIKAFQDQLSAYKTSKGGVQFPHDKPIPYTLVREIVRFGVKAQREG